MIDKENILRAVKKHDLPSESFWLIMGAAMVIHGVKLETNDIDIGCTPEAFSSLIASGCPVLLSRFGLRKTVFPDNISIYEGFYADSVEIIDGIAVADLASIKKAKLAFCRSKDLKDVELIDQYLSKDKRND